MAAKKKSKRRTKRTQGPPAWTPPPIDPNNPSDLLRERSGNITIQGDKLTSFLYDLLRDHLPASTVEKLVREASEPDITYSNGFLALYAHDVANRLR